MNSDSISNYLIKNISFNKNETNVSVDSQKVSSKTSFLILRPEESFFVKDVMKAVSMGVSSPLRSLGRVDPGVIKYCLSNINNEGLKSIKPITSFCTNHLLIFC